MELDRQGGSLTWLGGDYAIHDLMPQTNPERGTRRVKIVARAQSDELAFTWELLGCPYIGMDNPQHVYLELLCSVVMASCVFRVCLRV